MKTHVLVIINAAAYASRTPGERDALIGIVAQHIANREVSPISALTLLTKDGRHVLVDCYFTEQTVGLTDERVEQLNDDFAGLVEIVTTDNPQAELDARGILESQMPMENVP